MAEMIPDRLPGRASRGEERVFALLKKLDDDCLVYYEADIGNRRSDFIVILPDVGLLVIEAKGWYPNHIQSADTHKVTVITKPGGPSEVQKHPLRQALDYKFGIMDEAKKHRASQCLLHDSGEHAGRFLFPFGSIAVLNNISREQLRQVAGGAVDKVFPFPRVLTRDELGEMEELDAKALKQRLRECFDPRWPFNPLSAKQVDVLRGVIHPEIVIHQPGTMDAETARATLDRRQESHARSLGSGHRVIYGVAGSGKTLILLTRARLLAQDPEKNVLLLCFNKALASTFTHRLRDLPNVNAVHFHGWAAECDVKFDPNETNEDFGKRFLKRLEENPNESHAYDAVLIDESQDFACSWFHCAKAALKEPEDGDLVIVGDGNQKLYARRHFTWKAAGVNARGRTITLKFDLDRNYRNTQEILQVAYQFAHQGASQDSDAADQFIAIDPEAAMQSGPVPQMIVRSSREDECKATIEIVQDWLAKGIPDASGSRSPISPGEIGILYPPLLKKTKAQNEQILKSMADALSARSPTLWFNDPDLARKPVPVLNGEQLTVMTLHSSKGHDWRAVIILWADLLPLPSPDPDQAQRDSALLYVGMTRAKDMLCLTRSQHSVFTSRFETAVEEVSPA